MSTKIYGKDIKEYENIDIDDLLSKLTPEELEELSLDFDPDNSLIPPSARQRDQTVKTATGPFDRSKLIKFLREQSANDKDWEERVPYEKKDSSKTVDTTRKDQQKKAFSDKDLASLGIDAQSTEFDDVLNNATEEELVDLAAILGCTGMLNQLQFNASYEDKPQQYGGFDGVARHQPVKPFHDLPPNNVNVEASIKKLVANSNDLEDLNLNNMRGRINKEDFARIFQALENNNSLKSLHCSNTDMTDTMLAPLISVLRAGGAAGLVTIDLESNVLSGKCIVELLTAICKHERVRELRVCNQRQRTLGVQVETAVSELVCQNSTLLKLGIDLETEAARIKVRDRLQKNFDSVTRLARKGK